MKVREILESVNKTLECKAVSEETVKIVSENRNIDGSIVQESTYPYFNQISSQENVTKEKKFTTIPDEVKIGWIGQIDGRIRCEILGEDPKSVTLPRWEEDVLAAPDAYCEVYYYHCLAMAAITVGDDANYNRIIKLYNGAYDLYAKSVIRNRS